MIKVQRRAITDHVKTNTEHHLKLACEKLQEFQVLSTVNTANVKELEAEMVTAKKKIAELSEAVMKSNELQELHDKIFLTDEKLQELPEKDELDALIEEVKELKDKKLLKLQNVVNELQTCVNRRLQNLPGEVSGTKTKVQKLETAISKLRDQRQLDREDLERFVWSQILQIRTELEYFYAETRRDRILSRECRDKLTAYQEWWRKVKFVLFCIFFLVVFLVLLSLQSHMEGNR